MKKTIILALLGFAPVFAQTITGHNPLVSVGGDPDNSACQGPNGNNGQSFATGVNYGNKGVVNVQWNKQQQRLEFEISVHDAQPNTTYVVDIRCWGSIGTLTTDKQGTGVNNNIQIPTGSGSIGDKILAAQGYYVAPKAGTFYVDISVPNATVAPIGAWGWGDTLIAGPFDMNSK